MEEQFLVRPFQITAKNAEKYLDQWWTKKYLKDILTSDKNKLITIENVVMDKDSILCLGHHFTKYVDFEITLTLPTKDPKFENPETFGSFEMRRPASCFVGLADEGEYDLITNGSIFCKGCNGILEEPIYFFFCGFSQIYIKMKNPATRTVKAIYRVLNLKTEQEMKEKKCYFGDKFMYKYGCIYQLSFYTKNKDMPYDL